MARSGLIFDPATGLHAPDTSQIRDKVAQDWKKAFFEPGLPALDTDPTTPAGQLIDALTAEIEAKNAELLYLSNMFNPCVSDGRWQDALGHIYFLQRKLDEPTVVACRLSGLSGTTVPYGALVQSASGHTLVCTRPATIGKNGQAETTFRVAENGPVEIAPNSVRTIITTIPGWDTVNNAAAGVIGRFRETRSEFEARRAAGVAANAHGSAGALHGAIADIPGVLDVKVLENIGPDPVVQYGVTVPGHGIAVCVYGGKDADIAEAIYRKKDNGCDTGGNTQIRYIASEYNNAEYMYRIERPKPVNFWVKVTLGDSTGVTASVIQALKDAIRLDCHGLHEATGNTRIGLAQTIFASRFYRPAMQVEGIRAIRSIEIALSASAPAATGYKDVLAVNGNQEPVVGTANIAVVL